MAASFGKNDLDSIDAASRDICARRRIDEAAEDLCGKERIDDDAADICGKERIDGDVADICSKQSIDDAAAAACPRDQIDAATHDLCGKEGLGKDIAGICTGPVPPVIGIVPTQMPQEHLFRVNDYYINSIVLSGGVPLILPLTYDKRVYERLLPICDGFVLTGGQDVDPERYGISPDNPAYENLGEVTPMRDVVERLILEFARKFDVPLLGICRGMQTMNVASGGTLYIDLPTEFDGVDNLTKSPLNHWQTLEATESAHYIDVVRGTKLHDIIGADSAAANSFHHQGVKVVGPDFKPAAYATDGLVEAIECEDMSFMIGVQWHPEFFLGDKHMGNLFSSLVTAAAQARESGRLDAAEGYQIDDLGSDEAVEGKGRVLLHSMKKRYAV